MVDLVESLLDLEISENEDVPNDSEESLVPDVTNNEPLHSRVDLQCIICRSKIISSVFLPCSHAVCCTSCGMKREYCPKCNEVVLERGCLRLWLQTT